jgi:hypothetical protein
MKRLETATNCAVLLVAVLMSVVMVKQFLLPHYGQPASSASVAPEQSNEPLKGKLLTLTGVRWNPTHPTLVMALATYCHFCINSTKFYQRLSDLKQAGTISTPLVAAFPENTEQASKFTTQYHLRPDQTVSASLDSIGVSGTPTLLLVGSDGRVQRQWVGQLSPAEQEVVIKTLKN